MPLRRCAVFALLLCACMPAFGQDAPLVPATHPKIVAQAATLDGFVPTGWRLERSVAGDLNGDGRPDAVLILRDNDPKKFIDRKQEKTAPFDTNPRILAVVFAGANGGYRLALENHTFIARTEDAFQQDPLDPNGVQEGEVAIKDGTLRITLAYFSGNMGRTTYTLRYQNKRFELIGFDSVNVERNSGVMSDLSINYSTRQMVRKKGNISDDAEKVTRSRLPQKPLLTLDKIGDGLMFWPAGE